MRREAHTARYRIEEYVRWEDIDAAGIINYQAYLRFFALAEAELLRSAGLGYKYLVESLGIWLPRVHVECDFYVPVKLDELLTVEAYFSRIGKTSNVTARLRSARKMIPGPRDRVRDATCYVLRATEQGTSPRFPSREATAKHHRPSSKKDAIAENDRRIRRTTGVMSDDPPVAPPAGGGGCRDTRNALRTWISKLRARWHVPRCGSHADSSERRAR